MYAYVRKGASAGFDCALCALRTTLAWHVAGPEAGPPYRLQVCTPAIDPGRVWCLQDPTRRQSIETTASIPLNSNSSAAIIASHHWVCWKARLIHLLLSTAVLSTPSSSLQRHPTVYHG